MDLEALKKYAKTLGIKAASSFKNKETVNIRRLFFLIHSNMAAGGREESVYPGNDDSS